uniref:Uncharacterized protein n=1 Tax=Panagrolaimus sp. ES5 TaxID=591445 RepID=A0AC34GJ00_9BILA
MQGEPMQNVGDLVPQPGQPHQFAQIYFLDAEQALENREHDLKKLQERGYKGKIGSLKTVIGLIESMLRKYHPMVQQFKTMKERLQEAEARYLAENKEVKMLYFVWEDPKQEGSGGAHVGTLNRPTVDGQVFSIFKSDDGEVPPNGIYFGYDKDGSNHLRQVPKYSGRVDAAAYPLIFVFGQPGWTPGIKKIIPNGNNLDTEVDETENEEKDSNENDDDDDETENEEKEDLNENDDEEN